MLLWYWPERYPSLRDVSADNSPSYPKGYLFDSGVYHYRYRCTKNTASACPSTSRGTARQWLSYNNLASAMARTARAGSGPIQSDIGMSGRQGDDICMLLDTYNTEAQKSGEEALRIWCEGHRRNIRADESDIAIKVVNSKEEFESDATGEAVGETGSVGVNENGEPTTPVEANPASYEEWKSQISQKYAGWTLGDVRNGPPTVVDGFIWPINVPSTDASGTAQSSTT
ncbi:uncharacterized protein I303_106672 [Kwoniella dejecticola CBS 10117]|uniref:Uncharacterized protein n=1 Tax=Kwoniella dejecticola CBS 10117 TaxID=1296121 RepID=A0A1A5ZU12_9TREE|nr:uncharacterized protein I303_08685 [Kwoniella dejecticola CBS 10117]OBR81299.1 hypothetical protein I303_08685 [Kwoniella dejecticola CBS 10117]